MSMRRPCGARGKRQARQDLAIIDQHGAGAAFAAVASGLRAGESHHLAQIVEQQQVVGHRIDPPAVVERELEQSGHQASRPLSVLFLVLPGWVTREALVSERDARVDSGSAAGRP